MDANQEEDQIRQLQVQELQKKIDQGLHSLRRGKGVDGGEFFRALAREERAREGVAKRG